MVKTTQAVHWDALLSRIPKVIRCTDPSEKLRRELIHSHLLAVVQQFKSDESLVTLVHNYLSSDLLKKATSDKLPASFWSDQYTKLYRLPKSWKASQLIRISQGDLTTEIIKKIDNKDLDAITTLWYMVHQVNPTDDLHPVLLNKAWNDELWDARAAQVGNYLKDWVAQSVNAEGNIDWKHGACYKVIFIGDRAAKIKHIGGDEYDVPSTTHIGKDFSMLYPHDHVKCQLQSGILKVDMADCFGVGTGPHRFKISKSTDASCSFQQLLQTYINKERLNKNTGSKNNSSHLEVQDALSEVSKTRAREMQKKAAAAAKLKASKRVRTLQLEDSK